MCSEQKVEGCRGSDQVPTTMDPAAMGRKTEETQGGEVYGGTSTHTPNLG